MRFSSWSVLVFLFIALCSSWGLAQAEDRPSWNQDFEQVKNSLQLQNWYAMPAGSTVPDSTQRHDGKWSARVTRDAQSSEKYSTLSNRLPVDFAGKKITLRGYMKSAGIKGSASLWMRQDGAEGSLKYTNSGRKSLSGTHDWRSYEISFPLVEQAEFLSFGISMSGKGTLWVDEMEVLIDGIPLAQVKVKAPPETILNTDLEFENGSAVDVDLLNAANIDHLVLLGKVWGFLKYHHPAITSGNHHWDYDLFRFLPQYLPLGDDVAAQSALVQWIDGLGELAPCKPCAKERTDWQLDGDLSWINDTDLLGNALSERLQWVYKNRHSEGNQFFAKINSGPKNPLFERELAYDHLGFPDAGYRLLAAYRFGSIVTYWSPYRDLIGEDWDDVMGEFIPRLVTAQDMFSYRRELLAYVARFNDTHCNLFSAYGLVPPEGDMHPPFAMRFVENEAVVYRLFPDFPEGKADLEVGDIIETIDGRPVQEMVDQWSYLYGASNQVTRLRGMGRKFLFSNNPVCNLKIRRAGKTHEVTINRITTKYQDLVAQSRHDHPGDTFQKLSADVAYLKMNGVQASQIPTYLNGAQNTKGWILDLRGYPPEMLAYPLGRHLVEQETVFIRMTKCDLTNPGYFGWAEPLALTPIKPTYQGKVVILVDETTQSRAEFHALAFRAGPNAVVMGSTTAGADGTVSRVPFPGGDWCYITGKGVFNPDSTPTQRVGIIPDIEILTTIEGVRQGRDELLEAAVRLVLDRSISAGEMRAMLNASE